jgi:hypothetical protein
MTSSTGFITPDGFHIWWRQNQPDEIHLVTSDPQFNSTDGQHPGMWVTFSCNPKSANYHPQNFNRSARALAANGKPAPDEVPEHDRRLNRRDRLIAGWNKDHEK